MSHTPPAGPPPTGPEGFLPTPGAPGPWPAVPPLAVRRPARWPMFAMLVLTLIAVGAAVAAWLRPIPEAGPPTGEASPTFSEQEVADAKAKVCDIYQKIIHAVDVNRGWNGGDDPNTQLLIAINQRQLMIAGSAHLLTTLTEEPATPLDLATAARKLADLYQVIALDGLAADPSVPEHDAANEAGLTIERLCK